MEAVPWLLTLYGSLAIAALLFISMTLANVSTKISQLHNETSDFHADLCSFRDDLRALHSDLHFHIYKDRY